MFYKVAIGCNLNREGIFMDAASIPEKRKSPELASALSILVPGLGQFYVNGLGSAILWFIPDIFFYSWAYYIYIHNPLTKTPEGTYPGFFQIGNVLPMDTIVAVIGYLILIVISAQRANAAAIHNNTQIDTFISIMREKELEKLEKLPQQRRRISTGNKQAPRRFRSGYAPS